MQSDAVDPEPGHDGPATGVASFHLVREPWWRAPVALARLGTDQVRLRGTPGLRFARLLGTGRGATAMGADLARTALFAVWDGPAALAAFEDGWFAERAARVRTAGGEVYGVRLALLSGRGEWAGRDVLAGLGPGRARAPVAGGATGPSTAAADPTAPATLGPADAHASSGQRPSRGPVAVLTRATVRPSRWHRFRGSRPPVSDELARARGLRAAVGIGEAPVGLQATFSIWSDAAAVAAFARSPQHRAVVRRTREEGWYGEELFARFTPLASWGTWDGRDPLSSAD